MAPCYYGMICSQVWDGGDHLQMLFLQLRCCEGVTGSIVSHSVITVIAQKD